jgi:hypothetical protein
MRLWVEWLLSVALLLLVGAIVVAVVVAFVRWVKPKAFLNEPQSSSSRQTQVETDSANLDFDLSTPKKMSTIWKRRKQWRLTDRRYTGVSCSGQFYKIIVHGHLKTIDIVSKEGTQTLGYTPSELGFLNIHPKPKQNTHTPFPAFENPEKMFDPPKEEEEEDIINGNVKVFTIALEMVSSSGGGGMVLGCEDGELITCFCESSISMESVRTGSYGYMCFYDGDKKHPDVGYVDINKDDFEETTLRLYHQYFNAATFSKENTHEDQLATGIRLHHLTVSPDGDHLQMGVSDVRLFASNEALALAMPKSAVLMIPQLLSDDLPFPIKTRYLAIIRTRKLSPEEEDLKPKIIAVTLEISPVDGSIKIMRHRFENQIFQDEQEWFTGTLQPISQNKQLFDRMRNPCHGTFIANTLSSPNSHLVIQFSKQYCLLSGDTLCGAGFVIPK